MHISLLKIQYFNCVQVIFLKSSLEFSITKIIFTKLRNKSMVASYIDTYTSHDFEAFTNVTVNVNVESWVVTLESLQKTSCYDHDPP